MNFVDRLVTVVNPVAGIQRAAARERLSVMATFATSETANNGASRFSRTMRSWLPFWHRNPDVEIITERPQLVARSREAYRNQPIARSAIKTQCRGVIGSGLEMHCRIDRETLGFATDEEARAWERKTERLFRAWANHTDADARQRNTFYRLQQIAYRAALHTGEIFATLPLIPRAGTVCDLRVQLIEADRVSTPFNATDGALTNGSLWDGVETGKWGEPVAYYIETTVPSQTEINRSWQRVRAFGAKSGRRQVIHFYEEERPGQRRGLPWLAPILEPLKQIARYSEAELQAAVISGLFTVFIRHQDVTGDPLAGTTDAKEEALGNVTLGPGAMVDLAEGESIETANPGRPNAQFGPFVTEILKQIGMALDIPYEVLTKQFTSSYSASRAAIQQAWETFKTEREWFVAQFLEPIYTEWLAEMVAEGQISAPGFFDNVLIQRAWCGSRWFGPVPLQLDPVKEATAAKIRMETFLTTLSQESERIDNGDWRENVAQIAEEQKVMQALGVKQVLSSSGDPAAFDPTADANA